MKKRIFFNWQRLMINFLPDTSMLQIANKLGITYCSLIEVRNFLKEKGLIEFGRNGRDINLKLTEKGKVVRECLCIVVSEMEDKNEKNKSD